MSLINKMLQDLDARGTPGQDAFPSHVKPVAAPERRGRALRLAGLCVGAAVVAAALGWFAWDRVHPVHATWPVALEPGAGRPQTAAPARMMAAKITTQPVANAGDAVPAAPTPKPTPMLAPVAPVRPAGVASAAATPLPHVATDAAHTAALQDDAPRARRGQSPVHTRESETDAVPGAADKQPAQAPKSFAPLEPDSAEAREARKAAAIELTTRKTRLVRLARLSGTGHKGEASVEGRQESAARRAENEYGRALASLQDGRMSEALSSLQQVLRIDPGHDAARQTLVGLLVEANRPDDAMRELENGLSRDPRQTALAMLLARLQIERGGSGIETLTRSLPYVGAGTAEGAEYHAFLAGAFQRQGRQGDAVEQYREALRAVPGNGVWWMGMGISLRADKRNAEALDAFQKARESGGLSAELQSFVERQIAQLGR